MIPKGQNHQLQETLLKPFPFIFSLGSNPAVGIIDPVKLPLPTVKLHHQKSISNLHNLQYPQKAIHKMMKTLLKNGILTTIVLKHTI